MKYPVQHYMNDTAQLTRRVVTISLTWLVTYTACSPLILFFARSKRLNCSLKGPTVRHEMSPNTKNPPSDASGQPCPLVISFLKSPLLLTSFRRCNDETVEPRSMLPGTGLKIPLTGSGSTRCAVINRNGLTSQVLHRNQY